MKHKLAAILDGVPTNDSAFATVVREMPDVIKASDKAATRLSKDATSEEVRLASQIRSAAFMYRMPESETVGEDGGYVGEAGEVQDGEIAMPGDAWEEPIDPRLSEVASELHRLQGEGGTSEIMEAVDDMEIDGGPTS